MTTERELSQLEKRTLVMHIHLGLNPAHDLLRLVQVLHDEGKEAFEKLRGPRCEFAYQWRPHD